MSRYIINNNETDIVRASSAEDALCDELCFCTIKELLIERSTLFDDFDIENITDVVPEKALNDCYIQICEIRGFSLEESSDESHAEIIIKYNNEEIACITADYLDDEKDEDDDDYDDYDDDDYDDNASFYRDCFDSEEDADEWYESIIL